MKCTEGIYHQISWHDGIRGLRYFQLHQLASSFCATRTASGGQQIRRWLSDIDVSSLVISKHR